MKRGVESLCICSILIGIMLINGCAPAAEQGQQTSDNLLSDNVLPSITITNVACSYAGNRARSGIDGKYYADYTIEVIGSAAGPIYSSIGIDATGGSDFYATSNEWSNPENAAAYPHRQSGEPETANWDAHGEAWMADGDIMTIKMSVSSPNSEQQPATETRTLSFPC